MPTLTWLENDRFAECRLKTGHRWREVEDCGLDGVEWGSIQFCSQCRSRRHVWWNIWWGGVTSRWYEYPEGYLTTYANGDKRMNLRDQRVRWFRQRIKRSKKRMPRRTDDTNHRKAS